MLNHSKLIKCFDCQKRNKSKYYFLHLYLRLHKTNNLIYLHLLQNSFSLTSDICLQVLEKKISFFIKKEITKVILPQLL